MKKSEFHSYIGDENEQDACDSYDHMFHLFNKIFESGILVSGMSTVWEDTDGCVKNYRCNLDIYLMNMLPSSYGIITDNAINAPGHGNNVFDGFNAT